MFTISAATAFDDFVFVSKLINNAQNMSKKEQAGNVAMISSQS